MGLASKAALAGDETGKAPMAVGPISEDAAGGLARAQPTMVPNIPNIVTTLIDDDILFGTKPF